MRYVIIFVDSFFKIDNFSIIFGILQMIFVDVGTLKGGALETFTTFGVTEVETLVERRGALTSFISTKET